MSTPWAPEIDDHRNKGPKEDHSVTHSAQSSASGFLSGRVNDEQTGGISFMTLNQGSVKSPRCTKYIVMRVCHSRSIQHDAARGLLYV